MEDPLFVLIVVEHLDIDSEGVIEVNIMSWSHIEEIGEDMDDLGKDIWLRRVDAHAVSLDNNVALDCDLGLRCIRWSRRSFRASGTSGASGSGGLLSRASSGRRVVCRLSRGIGSRGHSMTISLLSLVDDE